MDNLKSHYKIVLARIFTGHRYLVENYGLSYYAAFVGCSAEPEGKNGSGKSTLMKTILDLQLPGSGRILMDDYPELDTEITVTGTFEIWLPQSHWL